MFAMGRLIAEAAGAKEGLEMEIVSESGDIARAGPAAPLTVTGAVQLVGAPIRIVDEKPSCPAETEALSVSVPELPAVNVNGETVMPDGKPVSVILMGPACGLPLAVIVTEKADVFCLLA